MIQAAKTGQATQTYAYDDTGRRIAKTIGSSTTNFLYAGPDIVAEYAASWGIPTAQYTHGPNQDEPLARITQTGAQYFHHDGINSVVALTNNLGATDATQRFDAWGNRIAATGTQSRYGYTGREPDESGLIYYRARYYDPTIGRFISRDPLGMVDGVNTYAYVRNNPVNFTDPEGTQIKLASASSASNSYFSTITDIGNAISSGYQSFAASPITQNVLSFVPGSQLSNNAANSFNAGNYGAALLLGVGSLGEAGLAVATGGESAAVRGVVAGQGGRFANLSGPVGDGLTAHHIPQAALNFTSRADGGAVVMTAAEHAATRTFTFKGTRTAIEDAGKAFRDVLAKDIRDVRSIVGNAYNQGLRDVLKYYRENFPNLMKKP